MSTDTHVSASAEWPSAIAVGVVVDGEALSVELADGRSILVPLEGFPGLAHATAEERSQWRLIGAGEGVHWPDVDEDLSVAGLLADRPSRESRRSIARWLESRRASGDAVGD